MPRGVKKNSGVKNNDLSTVKSEVGQKTRKAYPSREERVKMAEDKLMKLERLIAERKALVEKTEALALKRRNMLESAEKQHATVEARRDRLTAEKAEKKAGGTRGRGGAGRTAKKEKNEKLAKLEAALNASGKTVDEILAALEQAQ